MNCPLVHSKLPLFLYDDLSPDERGPIEKHLADCAGCRGELEALRGARQLLGHLPTADVAIDLPRLYQDGLRRHEKQARKWRRVAVFISAAAAVALLALVGLRLEVRSDGEQLVVRWGTPLAVQAPPQTEVVSLPAKPQASLPAGVEERLQLMNALVRAVADGLQSLDDRQRQQLEQIQSRINAAQQQSAQRLALLERNLVYLQSQRGE
jgi:hypothetical protein